MHLHHLQLEAWSWRIEIQASLGKKQDPIARNTRAKKGWECGLNSRPPSKHKVLSSNPSTAKTKNI
jgi:hypothetical protein